MPYTSYTGSCRWTGQAFPHSRLYFREPFTYAGRYPYYLRAWIILPDDHNKSKAELLDFFATKSAKVEAKYEFANAKQPYN